MNQPLVSVCIPTRRRTKKLIATLETLANTATSDRYEITVMLDNDDQETIGICGWLDVSFELNLIVTPPLGYKKLNSGYYARMEREALGEFIWIAGDDMLVEGDWLGALAEVPRTGYIVQPETSRLNESVYHRAEAQAFPIFPRLCWQQYQNTFPVPFDTNGHQLLIDRGWKTWFLPGVTMWHDRPTEQEIIAADPARADLTPAPHCA